MVTRSRLKKKSGKKKVTRLSRIEQSITKEKRQIEAIEGLSRKLTSLRKKLIRSGVEPRENYGQNELRKFGDKMGYTFTEHDINKYTNENAKDLVDKLNKLDEDVMDFTFPK